MGILCTDLLVYCLDKVRFRDQQGVFREGPKWSTKINRIIHNCWLFFIYLAFPFTRQWECVWMEYLNIRWFLWTNKTYLEWSALFKEISAAQTSSQQHHFHNHQAFVVTVWMDTLKLSFWLQLNEHLCENLMILLFHRICFRWEKQLTIWQNKWCNFTGCASHVIKIANKQGTKVGTVSQSTLQ